MAEEHGVKELKEALSGVVLLGAIIAKNVKDGVQLEDLPAVIQDILGDVEKKAELAAAWDKIEDCGKELADISLLEGIEIALDLGKKIPALLAALK